jgi:hypothetical protein
MSRKPLPPEELVLAEGALFEPPLEKLVNLREHRLHQRTQLEVLERRVADLERACAGMNLIIRGLAQVPTDDAELRKAIREGTPIRITFPLGKDGRLRITFESIPEEEQ